MPDQVILCQNCGSEFVFSEGEQDFFAQKNLEAPKLCPICRSLKQQEIKMPPRPTQKLSKS